MNFEGIIKKKENGKDQLTIKDMAIRSGLDETYLRKCIKHGFLKPSHYSAKYAVDGVELTVHDKEKIDKNIESIKARRGPGFTSEKNMREVATSQVIEGNRLEGKPVTFKYRERSAEEIFDNFWKGPSGKARMAGKLRKEVENIDRGGQWYDNPAGINAMPDNWETILWDKVKEEAARLNVLAMAGDADAEGKYRKLQARFPEQLPSLDAKIEVRIEPKEDPRGKK